MASPADLSEAPKLPDEFWSVATMRDALGSWHMGRVVAAYRNHPYHPRPIPQDVVGRWANMTQPQISRMENGPKIQDLDKLVHWAAILRIPERLLWFRLPPIHDVARTDGSAGFSEARAEHDLPELDAAASRLEAVTLARAGIVIGPPPEDTLTGAWHAALDGYVALDNLLGPGPLLSAVPRQAALIGGLIASRTGADRLALLETAARFAEFTGWLYQDAGYTGMAMRWTDRALGLAESTDDRHLVSYIWMRKSNIGSDAALPQLALRFADVSLGSARQLAPRIQAVAYRQQAHAHALTKDADACAEMLDHARQLAEHGGEDGQIAQYCTLGYVEMEAAHCWLELGHPDCAVTALEDGLRTWKPEFRRDLGLALARLAVAHAEAGAADEASEVARQAVMIFRQTRSHRTRVQLDRAVERLRATAAVDAAEDLRHMLCPLR